MLCLPGPGGPLTEQFPTPAKHWGLFAQTPSKTQSFYTHWIYLQRRRHFFQGSCQRPPEPSYCTWAAPQGGLASTALPSTRVGTHTFCLMCDGTLVSLNCPTPGLTHTTGGGGGGWAATVLSSGNMWVPGSSVFLRVFWKLGCVQVEFLVTP